MKSLDDYQRDAMVTAAYPDLGNNLAYVVLGLCGEAGELANDYKKVIRDEKGVLSEQRRQKMAKELGDVLWYVAQCASELSFSLEEIGQMNLEKLASRVKRGTLQGSGDNR